MPAPTVPEKMMYDTTKLTVKPGKKVKLTFANIDFMPHNIMLVNPGKADEVGLKAIALGARGFEVSFVPESPEILWASKLVDHIWLGEHLGTTSLKALLFLFW